MKVVLVNTSEFKGGAAVACNRLLHNLRENGLECKLLVLNKSTNDSDVIQIPENKTQYYFLKILFYIELIFQKLFKKKFTDYSFPFFGIKLSKISYIKEADVIHLHWINNSFINISDLQALIDSGKKVVWTLHDMWAFTGGCHYANNCTLYKSTCTKCPQLKYTTPDFSKKQQAYKKTINLKHITFITPSKWLKDIGTTSSLLKNSLIHDVPNCIDTTKYHKISREVALNNLGLKINKSEKILLYVAMSADDPRKGYSELTKALEHWLKISSEKINLVILGRISQPIELNTSRITIHTLGRLFDNNKIISAYSCADVFLMPSNQDNLPNTIMESLACGTPIVAFPVGGIPEMIIHGKTGYIGNPKDTVSFAEGIEWLLKNSNDAMREHCIDFARENYSFNVIFNKHIGIYTSI